MKDIKLLIYSKGFSNELTHKLLSMADSPMMIEELIDYIEKLYDQKEILKSFNDKLDDLYDRLGELKDLIDNNEEYRPIMDNIEDHLMILRENFITGN